MAVIALIVVACGGKSARLAPDISLPMSAGYSAKGPEQTDELGRKTVTLTDGTPARDLVVTWSKAKDAKQEIDMWLQVQKLELKDAKPIAVKTAPDGGWAWIHYEHGDAVIVRSIVANSGFVVRCTSSAPAMVPACRDLTAAR